MGLTSILTISCNDFATWLRFEVAVHLLRLNLRIEMLFRSRPTFYNPRTRS
jgi:hypothetical protein